MASLVAIVLLHAAAIGLDGLLDEDGSADVAIVLGNMVHPSGEPSQRLKARLDAAAGLFEAGRVKTVIVSGGLGKEGHQEADVMKAYLVERGVPAEVVISDPDGNTTRATAANASRIMADEGLAIRNEEVLNRKLAVDGQRVGVLIVFEQEFDT